MEVDNYLNRLPYNQGEVELLPSEKILSISESLLFGYGLWDSLLVLTNFRLLIRPRNASELYEHQIITPQHTQDIELKHISQISVKGFKRLITHEGECLVPNVHIVHDSGDVNLNVFKQEILYKIAESANLRNVERPNILRSFAHLMMFFRQNMYYFTLIVQFCLMVFIFVSGYLLYIGIINFDLLHSDLLWLLFWLIIFVICMISTSEYFGIGPFVYQEEWKRGI